MVGRGGSSNGCDRRAFSFLVCTLHVFFLKAREEDTTREASKKKEIETAGKSPSIVLGFYMHALFTFGCVLFFFNYPQIAHKSRQLPADQSVYAQTDRPASRARHYAVAYSTVYMRATLAKACRSPARTMFPASQFKGLSASGAESRAMTARQAACRLHAGDHSFFRMSRQISPVCVGWGGCECTVALLAHRHRPGHQFDLRLPN